MWVGGYSAGIYVGALLSMYLFLTYCLALEAPRQAIKVHSYIQAYLCRCGRTGMWEG